MVLTILSATWTSAESAVALSHVTTILESAMCVSLFLLWLPWAHKIAWFYYRMVVDSYLFSFRTVSEVADRACQEETSNQPVIRFPYGQRTIVFSNKDDVAYILSNPKVNKNYRTRFATDFGLNMLGMNKSGLIWNNDLGSWQSVRRCFDHTLSTSTLNRLQSFVQDQFPKILDKMPRDENGGTIDMLDALRWMTLNITLDMMLGLPVVDEWNKAQGILEAIVTFFKAWEFFLVRPYLVSVLRPGYQKHAMASRRLHEISEGLLSDYERQREQHPEKKSPLLDKAMENTELARSDLVQLVLESLLAGVDTSSVSLFYTLSFLSQTENRDLLRQAVEEVDTFVHQGDKIKAMSLPFIRACIKEAMRLKPVGPIIMRKAAQQDNVGTTIIQPGDSIILNLAQMNLKGVDTTYDPTRFLNEEGQHTPDAQLPFGYFPFGDGPKGCVGKHFAMWEMQAMMLVLLSQYRVDKATCSAPTSAMVTHWDIANQPQCKEDSQMSIARRNNVFLIGPSSTGKTTLLEQLRKQWGNTSAIHFHEETARQVLNQKGLTGRDLIQNKVLHMELQQELLQMEYASLEDKARPGTFHISDRSVIDALVYTKAHGTPVDVETFRNMPTFQACVDLYRQNSYMILFPVHTVLHDDGMRILGTRQEEETFFDLFETTLQELHIPYLVLDKNWDTRCEDVLRHISSWLDHGTKHVEDELATRTTKPESKE